VVEHGLWDELTRKPEWARRKEADRASYEWDRLIELVARDVLGPGLEVGSKEDAERVMRTMAQENRFCRRMLADAFNEFMVLTARQEVRSRIMSSPAGVDYVFLAAGHAESRALRTQELGLRCIVARSMMAAAHRSAPVIGLATERHQPGAGSSLDVVMLDIREWTPEWQHNAEGIMRDLGYFAAPRYSRVSHDEYPPDTHC